MKNKNKHKNKAKQHKQPAKTYNNVGGLSTLTNTPQTNIVKLLPLRNITSQAKVPKLVLTKEILASIQHYHYRVGNTEWSGTLIYKFDDDKTNVADLYNKDKEEDIVITASKLLLRDIGSTTLTEFNLTTEQQIEQGDYLMEGFRLGLIHTHHNMRAFFSGTDDQELQENSPHHEMYVSLIVNHGNTNDYMARICFKGEVEKEVKKKEKHSFKLLNEVKSLFHENVVTETEEVIFYIDMEIEREEPNDYSEKAIIKLKEEAEAKKRTIVHHTPITPRGVVGYGAQTRIPLNTSPVKLDDVKETLERIKERGQETSIKYSFMNMTPFIAKLITGDFENKKTLWDVINPLRYLLQTSVDIRQDAMMEIFEEFLLKYFGAEDDTPLTRLEVILICYSIMDTVNFAPHSTNPVIVCLVEMLEDVIVGEEEDLLTEEMEAASNSESGISEAVRSYVIEDTVEMDDKCVGCEGEGVIAYGVGIATCQLCQGLGVLAPMSIN